MKVADFIKETIAQEKAEGEQILAVLEALKLSLEASEARNQATEEKLLGMVAQIGDIPQLQAELASSRAELALARIEINDAMEAAKLIATINSAPVPNPEPSPEPVSIPEAPESELQTFDIVE